MKHQASVVLAMSMICTGGAAAAQPVADIPVVVTSGQAMVRAAPDRAYVTFAAESRAANPKVAQQENAQAMSGVQQKLREAGVPRDAVRTLAYDLQMEVDYVNGKRVPRGYVARNTMEVRIDEVDRVGALIDLVVGTGATVVSDVRFDLKNRDALEREALKQAVADARARAEAAAAGAGRTIDRILRIEEVGAHPLPPRPMVMAMRAEAASAPETPIAPGELEIRAQVTLTAAIK